MTIFITQFDWNKEEKPITADSVDSGFATLADVEAMMGCNWVTKSNRLLLYRGTAFSDYSFTGATAAAPRLRIPVRG